MKWTDFVLGCDLHYRYDTESGFFAEYGKDREIPSGKEACYTIPFYLPEAGTYCVQFEGDLRLSLFFDGIPCEWLDPLRNFGVLPSVEKQFHAGENKLSVVLKNTTEEVLPATFRMRLVDEDGNVVMVNKRLSYSELSIDEKPRSAPDIRDYTPGVGAAFKSAGRFGFTKGDGVLDFSMPKFGTIAKPYVFGNPKYTKNLLWQFSLLSPGFQATGDGRKNYEMSAGEEIKVDWSGVTWKKSITSEVPFHGRKAGSPVELSFHYSLLSPELLVETNDSALRLSGLRRAGSYCRVMLPLKDGIAVRHCQNGKFYDRATDGVLVENWCMFFDGGRFPEVPIMCIFRKSPETILIEQDEYLRTLTIDLVFDSPLQWGMVLFPFGFELFQENSFSNSWLEKAALQCRLRHRFALARPIECREYFKINGEDVEILQLFSYRMFDDSNHTIPLKSAPLPPPVALAAPEVSEIQMDKDAQDLKFPTKYGPLWGVPGSDWSAFTLPIPSARREFALEKDIRPELLKDFKEFLAFHQEKDYVPNPGVYQFLLPFLIPLFSFNTLPERERETLENILKNGLENACNPDFSYTGPGKKHCYSWYLRKEPFSGNEYLMDYLHIFGIADLPDCEKETILHHNEPFIEIDWGNGLGLYSISQAAMLTNHWEPVRKHWDTLKKAYDYFLVMMDWACMTAGYCENGRGWNDGTNYGAYTGFLQMAEIIGDEEARKMASYSYAKMAAARMALILSARTYYSHYLDVPEWFTTKTFPEELASAWPYVNYPKPDLHGALREQTLYNMTTEGHYPETWTMYCRYLPHEMKRILDAVEQSQPTGCSVVDCLEPGKIIKYHSNGDRLGMQEVFTYLMLCLKSHRYDQKTLLEMVKKANQNARLSKEFLGSPFSHRRIPAEWTACFLQGQMAASEHPRLTAWYGIKIKEAAYPILDIEVSSENAWLEFTADEMFYFEINGKKLYPTAHGTYNKLFLRESGQLIFKKRKS